MDSEIIAAFIGPVFTAMLAGAGILIKSIQLRHREQSTRSRDLEVANRTVDFINTYLQAQDKVLPPEQQEFVRERARRDLEVAYQTMMATANADYQHDSTGSWIEVVKRALLFGVQRPAANVVRVLFYIVAVIGLLLFTVTIPSLFVDPELQNDIPLMVGVFAFCLVVYILPIVLLYLWVRWLDRDRSTPTGPAYAAGTEPLVGHYGWQPGPGQLPVPPSGYPSYPPR